MKFCFFFAVATIFLIFRKEAQQGCQNSILGVPLNFLKNISAQKLLMCIHFRSLTKNFRKLVQKQSNVVVKISLHASRDIVWGKKISYKETRSLGLIFQFSVDNFWHGQQKIISFLQRIYRKKNFSKGRFFVFGKFDFRSGNPQDFRRNFWQI